MEGTHQVGTKGENSLPIRKSVHCKYVDFIMSDRKDISNDVHLLIFIEDPVIAGLIGYTIL